MLADRVAAADRAERLSVGKTVALRSDPSRIGVISSMTSSSRLRNKKIQP
jgi:hypothetical protein